jgi:hypothetical protein
MPLPSFYRSGDDFRPWRISHAAACGAGIGALAALFKTMAPIGLTGGLLGRSAAMAEIAVVAACFALLCAAAAMLRNFVARRLVWNASR